jgi:hypothetical protein
LHSLQLNVVDVAASFHEEASSCREAVPCQVGEEACCNNQEEGPCQEVVAALAGRAASFADLACNPLVVELNSKCELVDSF